MTTPFAKDATQKMQTLSQCITHAQNEGYLENFKVGPQGLTTEDGNSVFSPENVSVRNFYRFEGYSDPGDSSILYLIETSNKTKGILIDAYDTYADPRISKFMREVDDIQKRPSRKLGWFKSMMNKVFRK